MIDALRVRGIEVEALTDTDRSLLHTTVAGVPVVGDDSAWPALHAQGITHAFIGVGSLGDASRRRELFARVKAIGFDVMDVVHPSAVIARSAVLGHGVIVLANAVVNAAAVIGDNVIINTGSIIEHDCVIGDHVHVATGARLGGAVRIGAGAHIGIGATVRQGISIGDSAIVGAGAVVVDDVPPRVTVAGVPARFLREVTGVKS